MTFQTIRCRTTPLQSGPNTEIGPWFGADLVATAYKRRGSVYAIVLQMIRGGNRDEIALFASSANFTIPRTEPHRRTEANRRRTARDRNGAPRRIHAAPRPRKITRGDRAETGFRHSTVAAIFRTGGAEGRGRNLDDGSDQDAWVDALGREVHRPRTGTARMVAPGFGRAFPRLARPYFLRLEAMGRMPRSRASSIEINWMFGLLLASNASLCLSRLARPVSTAPTNAACSAS